jgi:DNA-binding transcriptional regulator YiaG
MKQTKTQKKHIDYSLGFPVVLLNAPMIKVRNQWALKINYNDYQEIVLNLLAYKPAKLTGNEVQFVRKHFQMTMRAFAQRFSIKHSAVIKWEKKQDKATKMAWTTEKDLRLFILDELSKRATELYKLYTILKEEVQETAQPIKIDLDKEAA